MKVPVGPSAGMVTIRTACTAPSLVLRTPWKLFRSLATKPGHTASTRMFSAARPRAYWMVGDVSAVFDGTQPSAIRSAFAKSEVSVSEPALLETLTIRGASGRSSGRSGAVTAMTGSTQGQLSSDVVDRRHRSLSRHRGWDSTSRVPVRSWPPRSKAAAMGVLVASVVPVILGAPRWACWRVILTSRSVT